MRSEVRIDERGGRAGAPRVLFLPGLGARAEGFAALATRLSDACRPVLVDYPEGEHARETPSALAQRIVDAAGPFDAVVASSYGGLVASALVTRGRVKGVALVGSFTRRSHLGWRSRAMRVLGWVAVSGLPGRTLASVASARPVPGRDVASIVPMTRIERRTVRTRVEGVQGVEDGPDFRDSRVKFLVLQGLLDVLVPATVAPRVLHDLPAGTPVHWLPTAGHVPYYTHPHEVARVLRPWVASLG